MLIWLRRSCRPIPPMVTLSIMIPPPEASMMRKSAIVKEDLPAPVLPTMPTCVTSLAYLLLTLFLRYIFKEASFESLQLRTFLSYSMAVWSITLIVQHLLSVVSAYLFSRPDGARDVLQHKTEARPVPCLIVLELDAALLWPCWGWSVSLNSPSCFLRQLNKNLPN